MTRSTIARPHTIRLVITRGEYDKLVQEQPQFMQNQFQRLTKSWKVHSLTLEGHPAIINQLEQFLGLAVN